MVESVSDGGKNGCTGESVKEIEKRGVKDREKVAKLTLEKIKPKEVGKPKL
mgnify:CR=1 FL=1